MRQKTAFRCLFYGLGILIVGLMTVAMLDDTHIENYCDEQKELTFDKCIIAYHDNFYYLFLLGLAMGSFTVFIGDLFFFLPWEKDNEIEKPLPTFCYDCGKSLTKGTLWCGTPTCRETYREKFYPEILNQTEVSKT